MRTTLAISGLLATALALPGCRMNERMTGTLGGAVGGGLLGAVAAGTVGGVLIGATGGAVAGYLIGDYMSDERERGLAPQARTGGGGGGGGGGACGVPQYEVDTYASRMQGAPSPVPTVTPAARALSQPTALPPTSMAARAAYERGRSAATAEEARAAYEESIRLDPARPEPWNALGLLAHLSGDRDLARVHLQRALALDPGYTPARLNLDRLDRGL